MFKRFKILDHFMRHSRGLQIPDAIPQVALLLVAKKKKHKLKAEVSSRLPLLP